MQKPYVIIHTLSALDGKIDFIDLPEFRSAAEQYEELCLHKNTQVLNIDGYLNGRVTTDENTTFYKKPDLDEAAPVVPDGDYVANKDADMYYISIDPTGRLGWQENFVDYGQRKAHVISVLTDKASNAYKAFLRRLGISYIIAGDDRPDGALALHKLATLFNMKRVMIGGGGVLNWSYLQAGLVDELSLLLAPIADASPEAPRLFKAHKSLSTVEPHSFTLIEAKPLRDSSLWLRYQVNNHR